MVEEKENSVAQTEEINIKTVVVGEGAVGKTSMIMSYSQDEFPTEHVPTVFDTYKGVSRFQKKSVNLEIWDTAGQPEYAKLRPLAYNDCDCFIICFSLTDRASY